MKWFKHDTDATTDAKLKKLILRYGAEGYAIYFHCLELIASDISENNITFELEHDAEIIADNLKIKGTQDISPIDTVNNIMRYIIELDLFQENTGHIFCYKLLKRLDKSMTSNSGFRNMIEKAKNHDSVMTNPDKVMQDKTKQDKTRLDKTKEPNLRAIESAQLLYDLLQINLSPTSWEKNPPNLETWSSDIEKINRLDGIDYTLINSVIRWTAESTFWNKNVMSGAKLRKQFTRLEVESKGKRPETSEERELRYKKREAEIENINNSDNIFN